MTPAQFEVLRALYAAVAAVGDALGSESTSGGLVLPCAERDLHAACRRFLPRGWRVLPTDLEGLLRRHAPPGSPEVARLATLLAHVPTAAALAGGADFRPEAPDRGRFFLCVFADLGEAAGTRALLLFERVET